jgi:RNase P protein component
MFSRLLACLLAKRLNNNAYYRNLIRVRYRIMFSSLLACLLAKRLIIMPTSNVLHTTSSMTPIAKMQK